MQRVALPASIFGGAVVIALGLYFGLRARGPERDPSATSFSAAATLGTGANAPSTSTSTSTVASTSTSVAATPGDVPRLVPVPAAKGDDPRAREVSAALEKHRARFVSECWKPSAAKNKEPASASYDFMLAFDKAGRERARGISETTVGPQARSDVAACLRSLDAPVTIAPGDAPTTVQLTLTLP